ncbi:MAG: hypothetical protein HOM11_03685 [Methylococcales bacterium]|nr:hypothetical protein [Methylococcales bacterium]MBT7443753.1 hypothetical protein [Methylococcales bacterium]
MHIWFGRYLYGIFIRPKPKGLKHIMFCFVDHYEPQWKNKDNIALERSRVDRWYVDYPKVAEKHLDADGCHPKHTFFYPEEEWSGYTNPDTQFHIK